MDSFCAAATSPSSDHDEKGRAAVLQALSHPGGSPVRVRLGPSPCCAFYNVSSAQGMVEVSDRSRRDRTTLKPVWLRRWLQNNCLACCVAKDPGDVLE